MTRQAGQESAEEEETTRQAVGGLSGEGLLIQAEGIPAAVDPEAAELARGFVGVEGAEQGRWYLALQGIRGKEEVEEGH